MDFEKYNAGPLPTKPKIPPRPDRRNTSPNEYRVYADRLEHYNQESELFSGVLANYRKKVADLENQFKVDALKEVGLEGHPKANVVYSKAWDLGHAYGLSEVFIHLEGLAEIVL